MFHNIHDFASAVFCIDRSQSHDVSVVERASGRLYKHSPRGLGIIGVTLKDGKPSGAKLHDTVWGIRVTGIVEGTDIERSSDALMFPFDADAFWSTVESVSQGLDDDEAEWEAQA